MPHTVEWKVRLYLFEGEGPISRVVLKTGTTEFTGHGAAQPNPSDMDAPEIGDEPAAGRAMHDLGRQLVEVADRDIEGVAAPATGRSARPETGRPLSDETQGG